MDINNNEFLNHLEKRNNNIELSNNQIKIISTFKRGKYITLKEICDKNHKIDTIKIRREVNFLETEGFIWQDIFVNQYKIANKAEKRFIKEKRKYLISLI